MLRLAKTIYVKPSVYYYYNYSKYYVEKPEPPYITIKRCTCMYIESFNQDYVSVTDNAVRPISLRLPMADAMKIFDPKDLLVRALKI